MCQATVFMGFAMPFFSQKTAAVFISHLYTTIIFYNGKTMPHSDLPFRALSVLHTSRFLFNKYGFHNVGVDRIIQSRQKCPKLLFITTFIQKNVSLK